VYHDVVQDYTVCVPVTTEVDQTYTVNVPHTETKTGVRKVCRLVPTTTYKTVTKDCGHYENQLVEVPACGSSARGCGGCGDCGGCATPATTTVCRKVWVSNVVTEQVPVTACERQITEEPYTYTVTVCKPETHTRKVKVTKYEQQTKQRTVKVCKYETQTKTRPVQVCKYVEETKTRVVNVTECVAEEKTREVKHTVCVPEKKSRTVNVTTCVPEKKSRTYKVTTCKIETEEKTETYKVSVPVQVQKEIDVTVCKMVAQTVTVPVSSSNGCSTSGRGRLFGGLLNRGGHRGKSCGGCEVASSCEAAPAASCGGCN
jgi:hypothetical protein